MLDTDLRRWIVTALVVLAIVALVAWARNGPGSAAGSRIRRRASP